jgi:D-glycero-D-manno-heptose 1,7-bisphosphate phosphatase
MDNSASRPAVFLDRDRTLIEDPGYIGDPDQVRLLEGAAQAVARLRRAGYAVVVATNQSGIARGLLTEEQLGAVHRRMHDLLRAQGTDVDAIYYCPYLNDPSAVCQGYRRDSDLRKPRPGMLLRAAKEMNLDLGASWMIGDAQRDVQAGRSAGCRTVLVYPSGPSAPTSADHVAADLSAAVEYVLAQTGTPVRQERNDPGEPELARAGPPPPRKVRDTTEAECPAATPDEADGPVLEQILEELRVIRRARQHEDFSVAKLAGAVAQAFALCSMGWGLYTWLNSATDPGAADSATIALLAAIALQVMALTFFTAASRK